MYISFRDTRKKKLPAPHASVATPTSAKLMINITSSLRLKHLNIVSSSYRWSHAESCVKNKMRFHSNITIAVSPLHHTLRDGFMDLMNKTFCGRIYELWVLLKDWIDERDWINDKCGYVHWPLRIFYHLYCFFLYTMFHFIG